MPGLPVITESVPVTMVNMMRRLIAQAVFVSMEAPLLNGGDRLPVVQTLKVVIVTLPDANNDVMATTAEEVENADALISHDPNASGYFVGALLCYGPVYRDVTAKIERLRREYPSWSHDDALYRVVMQIMVDHNIFIVHDLAVLFGVGVFNGVRANGGPDLHLEVAATP